VLTIDHSYFPTLNITLVQYLCRCSSGEGPNTRLSSPSETATGSQINQWASQSFRSGEREWREPEPKTKNQKPDDQSQSFDL